MSDTRIDYSDFKISFAVHPLNKDLALNTNEQAVARSIKNLVFTNPGERLFQNDIGSGIRQQLFENFDQEFDSIAEEEIREVISRYEPRAIIVDNPSIGAYGVVSESYPNRNELRIQIYFRTINIRNIVRIQSVIKRIR